MPLDLELTACTAAPYAYKLRSETAAPSGERHNPLEADNLDALRKSLIGLLALEHSQFVSRVQTRSSEEDVGAVAEITRGVPDNYQGSPKGAAVVDSGAARGIAS